MISMSRLFPMEPIEEIFVHLLKTCTKCYIAPGKMVLGRRFDDPVLLRSSLFRGGTG